MAQALGYAQVLAFAREHLQASEGVTVTMDRNERTALPTLVPATRADGACGFLEHGRCTIHAVSPYGCAFIDAHQSDAEYAARADALYRALHADRAAGGEYARVWEDLHARGLVAPPLHKRQYRLHKAMRREGLV